MLCLNNTWKILASNTSAIEKLCMNFNQYPFFQYPWTSWVFWLLPIIFGFMFIKRCCCIKHTCVVAVSKASVENKEKVDKEQKEEHKEEKKQDSNPKPDVVTRLQTSPASYYSSPGDDTDESDEDVACKPKDNYTKERHLGVGIGDDSSTTNSDSESDDEDITRDE